jgi:hypothetical protein
MDRCGGSVALLDDLAVPPTGPAIIWSWFSPRSVTEVTRALGSRTNGPR